MPSLSSRVFMSGNSQAVRIPQEFRLNTSKIEISRNADGDLVIHPIADDKGQLLLDALNAFDDDFINILEEDLEEPVPVQEREAL